MKKIITAIVCALPLAVTALNWTNYPTVISPAESDTLMLGDTTTNKQWSVGNMLSQTRVLPATVKASSTTITNEVVITPTNSGLVLLLPNSTNKPGAQLWFYNPLGVSNTSLRYTNGLIVSDGSSSTNVVMTNAGKGLHLYSLGTNWQAR